MALLEKQLVVKKSTIPGAGQGLFTKKAIAKGTRIIEYKGRITTWKEVENDSSNVYLFTVNPNHVINALTHKKALARYANDARGLTRVKGITNNCTYVAEDLRVYIEALKDIPRGSEILVSYGKEYWDVMRENIRLEKEQEKEEGKKTAKPKTKSSAKGKGTKAAAKTKKKTTAKQKQRQ